MAACILARTSHLKIALKSSSLSSLSFHPNTCSSSFRHIGTGQVLSKSFTKPTSSLATLEFSSRYSQIPFAGHPFPTILAFSESRILSALRSTYYDRTNSSRRAGGSRNSGGNNRGPWPRIKAAIDSVPNNVVFYGIIVANVIVYASWAYAEKSYAQFRSAGLLRFMYQNFTVSWQNFESGRLWTLLTACFSHAQTSHVLMNGLTFYFMAPAIISLLGNTMFLGLYLGGGLACSAVSLIWNKLRSSRPGYSSHGASGSINAVLAFYACAYPRTVFLLFFVLPVPAWACMTGLFAWDLYSSVVQRQGNTTDSAGHVGGMLGGVLFYLRMRSRFWSL